MEKAITFGWGLFVLAVYATLFAVASRHAAVAENNEDKRTMLVSTVQVWDGDVAEATQSASQIREEIKLRYQMGYHLVESVSTDFNVTLVFEK